MFANYYWNICHFLISDATYYITLNDSDPSSIAQECLIQFGNKCKPLLTLKEYKYLTKKTQHKCQIFTCFQTYIKIKQINEIMQTQQREYVNIENNR